MKRQVGIWMDTDKAVLINILDGKEELTTIESQVETRMRIDGEKKPHGKMASMLINLASKATNRQKQQKHAYFNNIMSQLNEVSDIYLFGPSKTKVEFEKEIKKHPAMARKQITIDNMGKLTQRQMVAHVREHFKH